MDVFSKPIIISLSCLQEAITLDRLIGQDVFFELIESQVLGIFGFAPDLEGVVDVLCKKLESERFHIRPDRHIVLHIGHCVGLNNRTVAFLSCPQAVPRKIIQGMPVHGCKINAVGFCPPRF